MLNNGSARASRSVGAVAVLLGLPVAAARCGWPGPRQDKTNRVVAFIQETVSREVIGAAQLSFAT